MPKSTDFHRLLHPPSYPQVLVPSSLSSSKFKTTLGLCPQLHRPTLLLITRPQIASPKHGCTTWPPGSVIQTDWPPVLEPVSDLCLLYLITYVYWFCICGLMLFSENRLWLFWLKQVTFEADLRWKDEFDYYCDSGYLNQGTWKEKCSFLPVACFGTGMCIWLTG